MKAYALHDAGELTDEEYAFWKRKFPAFQNDFYQFWKRTGRMGEETFEEKSTVGSNRKAAKLPCGQTRGAVSSKGLDCFPANRNRTLSGINPGGVLFLDIGLCIQI